MCFCLQNPLLNVLAFVHLQSSWTLWRLGIAALSQDNRISNSSLPRRLKPAVKDIVKSRSEFAHSNIHSAGFCLDPDFWHLNLNQEVRAVPLSRVLKECHDGALHMSKAVRSSLLLLRSSGQRVHPTMYYSVLTFTCSWCIGEGRTVQRLQEDPGRGWSHPVHAAAGGFPEEGGLLWQPACAEHAQCNVSAPMAGRQCVRGGGWRAEDCGLQGTACNSI